MLKYTPHFIPSGIVVVGCGGTGSRLVPLLSQLVRTTLVKFNPAGWLTDLPIFLIDDDEVEEKNLLRQNFIESDVGQKKAIVLANRYAKAYKIPIFPCVTRVTERISPFDLRFVGSAGLDANWENLILILAVDSAAARRGVLQAFSYVRNIFIIDAGNEDNFGQVKFFTGTTLDTPHGGTQTIPKIIPIQHDVNFIPYPEEYYRNLGESASERSCADLDQTLAINAIMATTMIGIIQNFLYRKPFTYHEVRYCLDGSVTSTPNTIQNWLKLCTEYPRRPDTTSGHVLFSGYILEAKKALDKMGFLVSETGELVPKPQEPEKSNGLVKKSFRKPKSKSLMIEEVESPEPVPPVYDDIDF